MTIEAHLNPNKDLLVTFSFPGEDVVDLCVGIDKRWMNDKDKDNFLPEWKGRITSQYEEHAKRPLSEAEMAELDEAIGKAV